MRSPPSTLSSRKRGSNGASLANADTGVSKSPAMSKGGFMIIKKPIPEFSGDGSGVCLYLLDSNQDMQQRPAPTPPAKLRHHHGPADRTMADIVGRVWPAPPPCVKNVYWASTSSTPGRRSGRGYQAV